MITAPDSFETHRTERVVWQLDDQIDIKKPTLLCGIALPQIFKRDPNRKSLPLERIVERLH